MTATTMHFGPEWMRPKHASRPQNPPSPPPATNHAPPGTSSYSALVAPTPSAPQEKSDTVHPFRYSKEDLLRIYKEGGGRGGLGLEVERWEGVVREVGGEPVSLKDWGDAEKKLFAGSLNSEVRRRQSSDYLSPLATPSGERPKLTHSGSGLASPMRERFGSLIGRRREGSDQAPLTMPRKLSLSSGQPTLNSARDGGLSSPRTRGPLTPGFDGVLNTSGDAWMSRRRASESGSKPPANPSTRAEEIVDVEKRAKINEEEEEHQNGSGSDWAANGHGQAGGGPNQDRSANGPHQMGEAGGPMSGSSSMSRIDGDMGMANLSIGGQYSGHDSSGPSIDSQLNVESNSGGPPPGLPDLASVEWSYLDPQGQVQGPFRADIIQKWYEEGYFSSDLRMKRTHLDTDWTLVSDLVRRASGDKIFLSHFDNNAPPPGLTRRPDPPYDAFAANGLNTPYQPIPTRSIHPSALDSYLNATSTASSSPSSSFGAARFGNGSPDPAAFGGRIGANMYSSGDSLTGGRPGSFAAEPAFGVPRRQGFADSPYEGYTARGGYSNLPPMNAPDNLGRGPLGQMPWGSLNNMQTGMVGNRTNSIDSMGGPLPQTLGPPMDHVFPMQTHVARGAPLPPDGLGPPYGSINAVNHRDLSRLGSRDPFQAEDVHMGMGIRNYDSMVSSSPMENPAEHQMYTQSPSLHYAQAPVHPSNATPIGQPSGQVAPASQPYPQQPPAPQQQQQPVPWGTVEESTPKRTGLVPFDDNVFPTTRNTIPTRMAPPPQPTPWAPPVQPAPPPADGDRQSQSQSPWFHASQSALDSGWGHVQGPNSLTVSNLGQHNQQQEAEALAQEEPVHVESPVDLAETVGLQPSPEAAPAIVIPSPVEKPSRPPPEERPKASARAAPSPVVAPAKAALPTAEPAKPPSPPPTATVKVPVWSTDEEKKKQPSLREIQEAEAKKQETRKAAERERARSTTLAASTATEETQSFTASWGLPTSQVAAAVRTPVPVKESSASSVTSTSSPATPAAHTPVWTAALKPVTGKKTMKEIQEEEENRKKAASKETAAAAARRAYAETTTKVPTLAQAAGGAWTTVGANGKTGAVAAAAVRPTMTPSSSASAIASSTPRPANGASTVRASAPVPAKPAPLPAAFKVDDAPVAPSSDFMKWLSDSLKGLSTAVNYEEITSMLLSFPLDVDRTTMEIISELIYANSTTLDGRRFAQEFVSRRKVDAVSKKTSGKAQSIADVVKAQPKPSQQSEWGGFKVVNKKKKGGRA